MDTNHLTSHPLSLSSDVPFRWLITGGCGFIGRNLVTKLVSEGGHSIRIIDNLKVGSREDLAQICKFKEVLPNNLSSNLFPLPSDSVELLVGDILDADLAMNACKDFDIIVHLAANTGVAPSVENPRMDCENNVFGTLNYLEAARHCETKRFVFASSGAPAGEVEPPIHEELPPHPISPYGASKLAGEGYCSAYYRTFGVDTVCLRFGNVYGPLSGKKNSVIAKFIKQAMAGEPLEIYGNGTQTRDFVYIDDLIDAIYKAATFTETEFSTLSPQDSAAPSQPSVPSPKNSDFITQSCAIAGEIFQIATSKEHTVNEVAKLIKKEFKKKYNIQTEIKYVAHRLGDVKRNYSDTTKAKNILGWQSEIELSHGIPRLIKWFFNSESNSTLSSYISSLPPNFG